MLKFIYYPFFLKNISSLDEKRLVSLGVANRLHAAKFILHSQKLRSAVLEYTAVQRPADVMDWHPVHIAGWLLHRCGNRCSITSLVALQRQLDGISLFALDEVEIRKRLEITDQDQKQVTSEAAAAGEVDMAVKALMELKCAKKLELQTQTDQKIERGEGKGYASSSIAEQKLVLSKRFSQNAKGVAGTRMGQRKGERMEQRLIALEENKQDLLEDERNYETTDVAPTQLRPEEILLTPPILKPATIPSLSLGLGLNLAAPIRTSLTVNARSGDIKIEVESVQGLSIGSIIVIEPVRSVLLCYVGKLRSIVLCCSLKYPSKIQRFYLIVTNHKGIKV